MGLTLHLQQTRPEYHASMNDIAMALHPNWFNDKGIEQIAADIQTHRGVAAINNGKVVGFLLYRTDEDSKVAELSWIAVRPELHRMGVGRSLVGFLEETLQGKGFMSLEVSTVAQTVEYEPYARTRRFYHDLGFADVRIDKRWFESGDDRLLLRKQLRARAV